MSENELNQTGGQIYELIPKVMADIGKIGKEKRADMGRGGNYTFRGIDDALNHCSPILTKHNVSMTFSVTDRELKWTERKDKYDNIKVDTYVYLTVAITFFAPDGSRITNVLCGEGKDAGDKATNKAMSAAMKYGLFFGLVIPIDKKSIDDSDYSAAQPEHNTDAPQAQSRGKRVSVDDLKVLWADWLTYNEESREAFRIWLQLHTKINKDHVSDPAKWNTDNLTECKAAITKERGDDV